MRVDQALGGTNRAGVMPSTFAMPPGMRMRYDLPATGVANCVAGYAVYICERSEPAVNWFLPAPPMITLLLDAGPLSVSIRNRTYTQLPRVSLWGATSRAFRSITHGGIMIGIGLTAAGWARLTARSAGPYQNRVGDLGGVIGVTIAARLLDVLEQLDSDADIGPALDHALLDLFRHDHPQHEVTAALESILLTEGFISVADVADRLCISVKELRRLATRDFGMPAKTLLSRARFVRSFVTWLMLGQPPSYAGIDTSYFDASHFIRDAQAYLGMTPRRFAAGPTQYLRTSLRARSAVIGAPSHVLHYRS